MKITLLFSPERQADLLKAAKKIVDHLKKKRHGVNQDALRKVSLGRGQKGDFSKFYHSLWKRMKMGDAVIAELTYPSTEIGYIISEAMKDKKPVLVLYKEGGKSSYVPLSTWKASNLLVIKEYTEDKLEEILDDFLSFASSKVDTKFILIITPEIDAYLRWKSAAEGVKKAEVVRQAVEAYMKKDEKYKKS